MTTNNDLRLDCADLRALLDSYREENDYLAFKTKQYEHFAIMLDYFMQDVGRLIPDGDPLARRLDKIRDAWHALP